MMDDEEIVKALSLEEQALDEFKRRKNSLPPQQTYSARSSGGKIKVFVRIFNKYHNWCEYFQTSALGSSHSRRDLRVW